MQTYRLVLTGLIISSFLLSSCSKKLPGSWTIVDTTTGDAFYSVNFVNEQVGWLNGHSERTFLPPEPTPDPNQSPGTTPSPSPSPSAKPLKPGEKPPDPLKENQGFEVLQTTDGGQTWKQIPDQFKHKIRSVSGLLIRRLDGP